MQGNEHIAFFTLNGAQLAQYNRKALAEDASASEEGRGFSAFSLPH